MIFSAALLCKNNASTTDLDPRQQVQVGQQEEQQPILQMFNNNQQIRVVQTTDEQQGMSNHVVRDQQSNNFYNNNQVVGMGDQVQTFAPVMAGGIVASGSQERFVIVNAPNNDQNKMDQQGSSNRATRCPTRSKLESDGTGCSQLFHTNSESSPAPMEMGGEQVRGIGLFQFLFAL